MNVISPGVVKTPILGKIGLSDEQLNGWLEASKQRVPLGRIGKPEEIAATAIYLAADATFSTGAELLVGGGRWKCDVGAIRQSTHCTFVITRVGGFLKQFLFGPVDRIHAVLRIDHPEQQCFRGKS